MKKNVKKIGDATEKKFIELLAQKGWWCHLFAYNVNGQPCDVVALKKDKSMLIDVKHCENGLFRTSRIEANQNTCFTYASSLGVSCGFALYNELDKQFYWLAWEEVAKLRGRKSFSVDKLEKM